MLASAPIDQRAQPGQILHILVHIFRLVSFQEHRNVLETWIIQDTPETFQPDKALTDMSVTIATAADIFLRIVQMENHQALEADDAVKLIENPFISSCVTKIVSSDQGVAGIETD